MLLSRIPTLYIHRFVILRGLLAPPEVEKLLEFFLSSEEIQQHKYGRDDGKEKKTKVKRDRYLNMCEVN